MPRKGERRAPSADRITRIHSRQRSRVAATQGGAMYARATTLTGDGDASGAAERYRQVLFTFRSVPGNRGGFMLVDRSGGRAVGVTLWESEDAMIQSRERADELRQQAASA